MVVALLNQQWDLHCDQEEVHDVQEVVVHDVDLEVVVLVQIWIKNKFI